MIASSLPRLGILVGPKGRGTNLRAIQEACAAGEVPAEIGLVVSPKADNPASLWSAEQGLAVRTIPPTEERYGEALAEALRDANVRWVCLAGYLRLLPAEVLEAFSDRVLNIHPALLPKFGGQGMYGLRVHEAVVAAGESESGCTVHRVTERYDEGQVLVQRRCPVLPDDTAETLAARVLEEEKRAYPEALRLVLRTDAPAKSL